jgi:hypothetical protein
LPSESLSNNSKLVLTPSPLKRSSITVFGAAAVLAVPVDRAGLSSFVEAARVAAGAATTGAATGAGVAVKAGLSTSSLVSATLLAGGVIGVIKGRTDDPRKAAKSTGFPGRPVGS